MRLRDCCPVHIDIFDPETQTTPATSDSFLEVQDVVYWLDVQAVVGHTFDPVRCILRETGNRAEDDFWGWHTSPDPVMEHAIRGRVIMEGEEWLYPPEDWMPFGPICTIDQDLAFELLTNQQPCVPDRVPPAITCPANTVVECTSSAGAAVSFPVTAADNCDPAPVVVCVPPPGSTFARGVTTVTCTATDASGNSSTCSFSVTVEDTTPPTITCPADMTVPPGPVTFMTTASDICDPNPSVVCTPPSGSSFTTSTTVTCTVTDASGNTATCTFQIAVGGQFPGDCNQDGTINIADAVCFLGYLFGGVPDALPCGDLIAPEPDGISSPDTGGTASDSTADIALMDWNGDGAINIADAVAVLNYLFGNGRDHAFGMGSRVCQPIVDCPVICTP